MCFSRKLFRFRGDNKINITRISILNLVNMVAECC